MQRGVLHVVFVVFAMAGSSGCYDWIPVRPNELGRRTSEIRVRRADGTTTRFSAATTYVDGRRLVIDGAHQPSAEFWISDVAAVERATLNPATTCAAAIWLGLAGAGLFVLMQGFGNFAYPDKTPPVSR
jgi:hypothetical protein